MPFTVALYPLPGREGVTSAQSIGGFESVGVLVEERDLSDRFGVIVHEMAHSLFEAQPPEFQQRFERFFTESGSPHARLAYQQINEAMATAIGNGWAVARATGEENPGSWYDDDRIDRFAKGIHPAVVRYLEQGRGIDEAFVADAIDFFASEFPEAIYDYELLLDKIVLMVDGGDLAPGAVAGALRRRFRVSSVSSSAPIDHPRSLETLHATGETIVVALSQRALSQLAALARAHAVLASPIRRLTRAPGEGYVAGVDEAGRAWILIRAEDDTGLARVVDAMHRRGEIDPASPWVATEP